jgi:outer membrane protein TolC
MAFAEVFGAQPVNIIQNRSTPSDIDMPDVKPLTLADCYKLALKQSEIIAIDAEYIKIAEARFLQALSIMLPHLSFLSSDFQQGGLNGASTEVGGSLVSSRKDSQRQFNVTQTLFNGFKAFAAIKGSGFEKNQRINEKIRAEQLLLIDVSGAFYLLKEKREDLKIFQKTRTALRDRVKSLRKRESLGRSRPSEVVNAKAQLYSVEADIEISRNQEVLARELLEFLVGGSIYSIVDTYDIDASLEPMNHYVLMSVKRPDVVASKFAWEIAKKEVLIVNSAFLPEASVDANYYTQRTSSDKDVDWDVTLSITVPIFDGGYTIGRSNEAIAHARQKELEYRRLARKTPYEIRDAYIKLKTAISVHELLEKEYKTSKLNYRLQRKDYELSLVSNLDVLAAIQSLQNAQRDYVHAMYESKRLYWQLRVAVGESIGDGPYDII